MFRLRHGPTVERLGEDRSPHSGTGLALGAGTTGRRVEELRDDRAAPAVLQAEEFDTGEDVATVKTLRYAALLAVLLAPAACSDTRTDTPLAPAPSFTEGNIGDPCDPATYNGPYRCVPDSGSRTGYSIAQ